MVVLCYGFARIQLEVQGKAHARRLTWGEQVSTGWLAGCFMGGQSTCRHGVGPQHISQADKQVCNDQVQTRLHQLPWRFLLGTEGYAESGRMSRGIDSTVPAHLNSWRPMSLVASGYLADLSRVRRWVLPCVAWPACRCAAVHACQFLQPCFA